MTMKHTVFNITVILFLFSAAVQAQSPGGVAGPVKWATGKDNGTVQLSGTGGMTFVGVGRIQQGERAAALECQHTFRQDRSCTDHGTLRQPCQRNFHELYGT